MCRDKLKVELGTSTLSVCDVMQNCWATPSVSIWATITTALGTNFTVCMHMCMSTCKCKSTCTCHMHMHRRR